MMMTGIMSKKTLLEEKILELYEESENSLSNTIDTKKLFYCQRLKRYVITPPGRTELVIKEVPKVSCYDCYDSCSFQRNNIKYLDELILTTLTNRNGSDEDFLGRLEKWYKKRLIRSILNTLVNLVNFRQKMQYEMCESG